MVAFEFRKHQRRGAEARQAAQQEVRVSVQCGEGEFRILHHVDFAVEDVFRRAVEAAGHRQDAEIEPVAHAVREEKAVRPRIDDDEACIIGVAAGPDLEQLSALFDMLDLPVEKDVGAALAALHNVVDEGVAQAFEIDGRIFTLDADADDLVFAFASRFVEDDGGLDAL